MGITALTALENHSMHTVHVVDVENAKTTGHGVPVGPGGAIALGMWIPWAPSAGDFRGHRLDVVVEGGTTFSIWQDGDFVRFSTDGAWHPNGRLIDGFPRSGIGLPVASDVDVRTLVVQDDCVALVDFHLLPLNSLGAQTFGGTVATSLCTVQPPRPWVLPSDTPRTSSVAFSVAGPASDAFDRGEPGARFRYDDSGTRYAFHIDPAGVVVASRPGGPDVALTRSVSYDERRKLPKEADPGTPAPAFELIVSNGSRMFAKERGANRFWCASMDHIAIGGDDTREFTIPSTYFKLDPEFNAPNARTEDLLEHVAGCFGGHPAVERIPFFRTVLEHALADFMVVRMVRRTWHLIDARPPLTNMNPNVLVLQLFENSILPMQALSSALSTFGINNPVFAGLVGAVSAWLTAIKTAFDDRAIAPPGWVTTYDDVNYCSFTDVVKLTSIRYWKVLDIGVGHVHLHEQSENVTGGELQPLRTGSVFDLPGHGVTYMELYQIFNGPVRDADCYIDGTCNYYLLVQLKENVAAASRTTFVPAPDAYGLLFIDEQSFFTGRWRLAHPDDYRGMLTGLSFGLSGNPPLYGWNPKTYWCPFRAGLIHDRSRLAVSRQVAVVNGVDPAGTPVLYSINYSYSTMDRTWRWRSLPPGVQTPPNDVPVVTGDLPPISNMVFPETLRLREDMTLHVRGRDATMQAGYWYQRYLPATNTVVPPKEALVENQRPATGYTHAWKFLPDAAFAAADQFSHFGVYDTVRSRVQYYALDGVPDGTAEGPWIDVNFTLSIRCVKFWWPAPLYPELTDKRPPSLYNHDTRLRIVKRGSRWIAMHWDKRDDKLLPFDGLPLGVTLKNALTQQSITVTLRANTWVDEPPAVHTAYCWFEGADALVAYSPPMMPGAAPEDNVARVRMAALQGGRVVHLLDADASAFAFVDGVYQHRWTPSAAGLASLRAFCSDLGVASSATSIWFEDLVGHVSTAESRIVWGPPPALRVTVTPAAIPYGIPVPALVVHAVDAHTGAVQKGKVRLGTAIVADLDQPFGPRTFPALDDTPPDPVETGPGKPLHPPPHHAGAGPLQGAAIVETYPATPIPFNFYTPAMRVAADRTSFVVGQQAQLTVSAVDMTTQQNVAARVVIANADAGASNARITRTFQAGDTSASVVATGYPAVVLAFTVAQPPPPPAIVNVTVDPQIFPPGKTTQVLVRAQDGNTGLFVSGATVTIDGRPVGSTDVRFSYTAPKRIVIRRNPKLPPADDPVSVEVVVSVTKPGYKDGSTTLEM